MTSIGLISDTHGHLSEQVFPFFQNCDEIWHAGDIGNLELLNELMAFKPTRAVYGNIDGQDIRSVAPEHLVWHCEKVKVLMTHIGGKPPKYNPISRKLFTEHQPQLFITGHSHILNIQYDHAQACLFMNPGAAGKQGWHQVATLVRFKIDGSEIQQCEIKEFKKGG
jgi:putative phosphoesterase